MKWIVLLQVYYNWTRVYGTNIALGLNFFITEIPYEVFTYTEQEPMRFEEKTRDIYPYMLVNIGSGVRYNQLIDLHLVYCYSFFTSILKVTGPDEFSRISGTSVRNNSTCESKMLTSY